MRNRIKIAIDLLWLKPQSIGGTEVVIRTLLDNFGKMEHLYKFVLLAAKDNAYSLQKYCEHQDIFEIMICNIATLPIERRLLWQNIHLPHLLEKANIHNYFCPVYVRPIRKLKGIKSIVVIHDLQLLHYPEYFSKARYYWCRYAWKRGINTSDCVVTVSKFCRQDIMKHYKADSKKIKVIYNPISIANAFAEYDTVAKKYSIGVEGYYYTILSPLRHKNLITLLMAMEKIKSIHTEDKKIPKLLISGINGGILNELKQYCIEHNLQDLCIFTGYVSDKERNTLMKESNLFLFPSVFEGFGMPIIEAMQLGCKVITTKCASIPEISQGKAIYVEDPYSVDEWIEKIEVTQTGQKKGKVFFFEEYNEAYSARQYLELFNKYFKILDAL